MFPLDNGDSAVKAAASHGWVDATSGGTTMVLSE